MKGWEMKKDKKMKERDDVWNERVKR